MQVPGAVIGEATFFVAFVAGEPVALAGVAAEAGFAVGGVLLPPGLCAGVVGDDVVAAQVVAEPELHGGIVVVGVGVAYPDDGDALLVVGDVHVVVLGRVRRRSPAVVFEPAQVVGDLDLPTLAADQFFHPLAGGVVEVVGVHGWFGGGGLGAERHQLVGVVPVEVAGGGFRGHVAVGVEGVVVSVGADAQALEAVAGRVDGEAPGESAGYAVVVESKQAAQCVVAVGLGVGAGAGEVGAAGPVHPRGRVRWDVAWSRPVAVTRR
jgi:hypothetical protein